MNFSLVVSSSVSVDVNGMCLGSIAVRKLHAFFQSYLSSDSGFGVGI